MTHLDTHVFVWLYAGEVDRLSTRAQELLRTEALAISPMVLLEARYLREIGRITPDPAEMLAALEAALGLEVSATAFADVAREAIRQDWTRDPFDRLITAQALVEDAWLLTRDDHIQEHCSLAVW